MLIKGAPQLHAEAQEWLHLLLLTKVLLLELETTPRRPQCDWAPQTGQEVTMENLLEAVIVPAMEQDNVAIRCK